MPVGGADPRPTHLSIVSSLTCCLHCTSRTAAARGADYSVDSVWLLLTAPVRVSRAAARFKGLRSEALCVSDPVSGG